MGEKRSFAIVKADDDLRRVFGWANVAIRPDGEQITDYQEDVIDPEDIENAAYNFVLYYRTGGELHQVPNVATLIESCVFTAEKQQAMGLPDGALPIGWWIGFQVNDDGVWAKVKDGTYSMFSIEGTAVREEIVEDEGDDGDGSGVKKKRKPLDFQ